MPPCLFLWFVKLEVFMLGEVAILGKTTKLYLGQLLVSGSSGPLQGGGGCILKGGNFTLRIGGNLLIVNPILQNNESILQKINVFN